jgi:hypothetical protein
MNRKARIFVQLDDVLAEQWASVWPTSNKRDIERVRQTLTSAVNLEKVVRGTPIGDSGSNAQADGRRGPWSEQADQDRKHQDNLFEITALMAMAAMSDADNAKIAQDIVQKLIDIFREENLAGNRGEMTSSLEFMDQQLSRARRSWKRRNSAPGLRGGNPELARAGYRPSSGLNHCAPNCAGSMPIWLPRKARSPRSTASWPAHRARFRPRTGGRRTRCAGAGASRFRLRARGLTDNHPDVIAARNQVNLRARPLASEGGPGGVPNPAYSSLESIRGERQANCPGADLQAAPRFSPS